MRFLPSIALSGVSAYAFYLASIASSSIFGWYILAAVFVAGFAYNLGISAISDYWEVED
jgi:hypothetical protein